MRITVRAHPGQRKDSTVENVHTAHPLDAGSTPACSMELTMKELLRVDIREKYRDTLFKSWAGQNLPAQHRFIPSRNEKVVNMSFVHPGPLKSRAESVIESEDGGETWVEIDKDLPACNLGFFVFGRKQMILQGGIQCSCTEDGGTTWHSRKIEQAGELLYTGLEIPNSFSAIMITRGIYAGRVVIVSSFFTGQEGPDGELLASAYTDDWGDTWQSSKLFTAPDPLPSGPEAFGEPAVVEMPSGWLWMVVRSLYGELWQCVSRDGGSTWGPMTPTGFVSPLANCYAMREPMTGATVLCWNATQPGILEDFQVRHGLYTPRTNLVFSVSHDNTRTWTVPVSVEAWRGQYPTIHFAAGRMFIMYQSSPGKDLMDWKDMGLTLVAYDTEEILQLPAMTPETMRPWIDAGLIRHWRAVQAASPRRKIS